MNDEPVAYMDERGHLYNTVTHPENYTPLYKKREWVGLTDEEIREFELWLDDEEEKHGWNPPADIVKYLEAKLKEKNT